MKQLIYEGSVKNLWSVDDAKLEFEYTDAFSVFDWGRMPEVLAHKGESLAALGAYFFEVMTKPAAWQQLRHSRRFERFARVARTELVQLVVRELERLADRGLKNHYEGRSGSNKILVRKVAVNAPDKKRVAGQSVYHYKEKTLKSAGFVPLEVIFRFGVPGNSNLLERLTPSYAQMLGFSQVPVEGATFDFPVIEFFSKLEKVDRFLSLEQALHYSGLDFQSFETLYARTACLALWLAEIFEARGLELWDGKFEWALLDGEVALVDSIGPDELRLREPRSGALFSKEFLRTFYRTTDWFSATKRAKKKLESDAAYDWKKQVLEEAGEPPLLSAAYREAADALYPSLTLAVTGENPGKLGLPLPILGERMRRCQSP